MRRFLDQLYRRFNHRKFLGSDPVQFPARYPDPRDREIVALIAASLAYGRVAQIHRSVDAALARLGASPFRFLRTTPASRLPGLCAGFRHRFTTDTELAAFLRALQCLLETHGALETAFRHGVRPDHETVLPALNSFVEQMGLGKNSLVPRPDAGSACKRLHLFLRWMVRRDEIDPGGWETVGPARLIIPLDTHLFRISRKLGLTRRNSADGKTALEITRRFRRLNPDDPVKYDFALSRLGILNIKSSSWRNSMACAPTAPNSGCVSSPPTASRRAR